MSPSLKKLSFLSVWDVGYFCIYQTVCHLLCKRPESSFSTFIYFLKEIWEWFCVRLESKFLPFVFSCGLRLWSDVFSSEKDDYVFELSCVVGIFFPNVCRASLRKDEEKWLIFIASKTLECILRLFWKRSSNSVSFSILLTKTSVFVPVGFISADDVWGHCCDSGPCISLSKSVERIAWLWILFCGDCPTIGNVLSGEIWVLMFCGWVSCCGVRSFSFWIRPVSYSGIILYGALCPVTMW